MFTIIEAAGWPIWFLLICSILALAIVIERFYCLRREKVIPKKLVDDVVALCRQGVPNTETIRKIEGSCIAGEVLAAGLRAKTSPLCSEEELHAAFESQGRIATHQLEKYLNALATIATAAPLLGLFGTVIGMIEIFGAQTTAGAGNPAELAHGISVALYNTAFGLLVAIPSLILWRYFRARVNYYLLLIELGAERLAHHLQGFKK